MSTQIAIISDPGDEQPGTHVLKGIDKYGHPDWHPACNKPEHPHLKVVLTMDDDICSECNQEISQHGSSLCTFCFESSPQCHCGNAVSRPGKECTECRD